MHIDQIPNIAKAICLKHIKTNAIQLQFHNELSDEFHSKLIRWHKTLIRLFKLYKEKLSIL